jgi:hypothetical protein
LFRRRTTIYFDNMADPIGIERKYRFRARSKTHGIQAVHQTRRSLGTYRICHNTMAGLDAETSVSFVVDGQPHSRTPPAIGRQRLKGRFNVEMPNPTHLICRDAGFHLSRLIGRNL